MMFDQNLKNVYSKQLVKLAANIPRTERLVDPDATAGRRSPLCGSQITVDIKVEDGVITDYGQTVRACVLGQSAAALVGALIVGASVEEFRTAAEQMRAMLREGGPAPTGRWADLAVLEPARDFKNRHASILLPFDAVLAAVAEIEARDAGDTFDAAQVPPAAGLSSLTVSL